MNENDLESVADALEARSRDLFRDSVAGIDMRTRSRLTQARHAALAAGARPRPWLLRTPLWASASGVTAAAVLGAALWIAGPTGHNGTLPSADSQLKFEDLDIIAASDESSGDALDMLQDDIDFYAWADKAANAGPTA